MEVVPIRRGLAREKVVRLNVEHQAAEEAPVRLDERGGVSRIFHNEVLQQK
jgi:hypothetical protein